MTKTSNRFKDLFPKIKTNFKKTNNNSPSLLFLFSEQEQKPTQSQIIKIGNLVEKLIALYIEHELPHWNNIKPPVQKRKKEYDILFEDKKNKTIFYAEIKANLNLDTEKAPATWKKVLQNIETLKTNHPKKNIDGYLVTIRYLFRKDIPESLLNKFKPLENKLIGLNDFFGKLNLVQFENMKEYISTLNSLFLYMKEKPYF